MSRGTISLSLLSAFMSAGSDAARAQASLISGRPKNRRGAGRAESAGQSSTMSLTTFRRSPTRGATALTDHSRRPRLSDPTRVTVPSAA